MLNELDHPESLATTTPRQREARRQVLLAELDRLRKRIDQQERSLTVLVQALTVLRNGNRALREENRDLQLQLQEHGRSRASSRRIWVPTAEIL